MKTYQSINELIDDSVEVKEKRTIFISSILRTEEKTGAIKSWARKLNGQFSVNNNVIAFVFNDKLYSTPYTKGSVQILRDCNFRLTCFYVPFSNWNYPKDEESKWLRLLKEAEDDRIEVFEYDCITFCEEHNIGKLSDDVLEKCILVPNEGIPYSTFYSESKNIYYPMLTSFVFDGRAKQYLGTYCYHNDILVFVYCNGKTYITKGFSLISALNKAGYNESWLYVPFANGEFILNHDIATRWDAL